MAGVAYLSNSSAARTQDLIARNTIELYGAAAWEEREFIGDRLAEARTRDPGHPAEQTVEAESLMLLADEVEHEARWLVLVVAEAAAELLQEEGRALGGPEQQESVHERQVDALVVEIAGEEHVHFALAQPGCRTGPLLQGGVALHGGCGDAGSREPRSHEDRVFDAHAEAEGAERAHVGDSAGELCEHQRGAGVVARVEIGQRRLVVSRACPTDAAQVGRVRDAEVLERHQELLVEGLPEPELARDVSVEVGQQGLAVASLGSCREAAQEGRSQAEDDDLVRRRRQVVTLVDDDVTKVGRAQTIDQPCRRNALDGGEDVVGNFGAIAVGHQLAESAVLCTAFEVASYLADDPSRPLRCSSSQYLRVFLVVALAAGSACPPRY